MAERFAPMRTIAVRTGEGVLAVGPGYGRERDLGS